MLSKRELEVVDQRPVCDYQPAPPGTHPIFRHERPFALTRAVFQWSLESRLDCRFVRDAELGQLVECGVVGFDGSVSWLKVEGEHCSEGWCELW